LPEKLSPAAELFLNFDSLSEIAEGRHRVMPQEAPLDAILSGQYPGTALLSSRFSRWGTYLHSSVIESAQTEHNKMTMSGASLQQGTAPGMFLFETDQNATFSEDSRGRDIGSISRT